MYKIIYCEEELKKFFNLLPPLKSTEVFFVSLASRNKYLTKSEQEYYGLGRTEMFEKRIIRYKEWERFLRTIRKFETAAGSYTTKKGFNIPNKSIVCYMNINPSDTLKTYKEFNKTMTEYMYELAHCATDNRNLDDICKRVNKMDNLLLTCYQKNRGVKHFIDMDFDIPKNYYDPVVTSFLNDMKLNEIEYFVIDTKSGFHVLLKRDTVNYNFNDSIYKSNEKLAIEYMKENNVQLGKDGVIDIHKEIGYEIILNKNEMIPLPGTLAGGHEVKLI